MAEATNLLIYLSERSESKMVVLRSAASETASPVHSEMSTAFAISLMGRSLAAARSARSCKLSKLIELVGSAAIATSSRVSSTVRESLSAKRLAISAG